MYISLDRYLGRVEIQLSCRPLHVWADEGVRLGLKPPQYLKPGDIAELFVEGLGKSKQRAVAFRAS